jgi:hypothetical protein
MRHGLGPTGRGGRVIGFEVGLQADVQQVQIERQGQDAAQEVHADGDGQAVSRSRCSLRTQAPVPVSPSYRSTETLALAQLHRVPVRRLRHCQGQTGSARWHTDAGELPERDHTCRSDEHEDRRHPRQHALDDHRGRPESQEDRLSDASQVGLD